MLSESHWNPILSIDFQRNTKRIYLCEYCTPPPGNSRHGYMTLPRQKNSRKHPNASICQSVPHWGMFLMFEKLYFCPHLKCRFMFPSPHDAVVFRGFGIGHFYSGQTNKTSFHDVTPIVRNMFICWYNVFLPFHRPRKKLGLWASPSYHVWTTNFSAVVVTTYNLYTNPCVLFVSM